MTPRRASVLAAIALACGCSSGKQTLGTERTTDEFLPSAGGAAYFARWPNGPPSSPSYFPLTVWLQEPANASRFQDVGINLLMGLYQGPTEEQLSGLETAQMPAVCAQAGVWQAHLDDPLILGWMQDDQPDDAQLQSDGSYGPCVDPTEIVSRYSAMTTADPTRPVFMNLGRGAVDAKWEGRGSCGGHEEMYPVYATGADVLTFVTYPVNDGLPLETVAAGVDAVDGFAHDEKLVFASIEAADIGGNGGGPTPEQINAEVWMAIIHGAGGIQYFCHRIQPSVNETACLDDAGSHDAIRAINARVTSLAPVLNSPSLAGAVVATADPVVRVDTMVKRDAKFVYVFVLDNTDTASSVHFSLAVGTSGSTAEVLGENRTVTVSTGAFDDAFTPRATHFYRIPR